MRGEGRSRRWQPASRPAKGAASSPKEHPVTGRSKKAAVGGAGAPRGAKNKLTDGAHHHQPHVLRHDRHLDLCVDSVGKGPYRSEGRKKGAEKGGRRAAKAALPVVVGSDDAAIGARARARSRG